MNVDISVATVYVHCRERSMPSLSNDRLRRIFGPARFARWPRPLSLGVISSVVDTYASLRHPDAYENNS